MDDLTRKEVEEELQRLTAKTKDHLVVKNLMVDFLARKKCSPFMTQQVLKDLTSYEEYLLLMN